MTSHQRASDDRQLLEDVSRRDADAFERLYRLYFPRVYGFLRRFVNDPQTAEEAADDTLLTVWKTADRFEGRSKPSSWIFGIAYRVGLKAVARQRRFDSRAYELVEEDLPKEVHDAVESTSASAQQSELRAILERGLRRLSADHRAVLVLAHFQQMSYGEIAEVLQCPVNTVKTRAFHAKKKLRAWMRGVPGIEESLR